MGVTPWISWADAHWEYSHVFQYSMVYLQDQAPFVIVALKTSRWNVVISAFVFFGFFGFSDEARKNYHLLASTITKRLGYTTFAKSTASPDSCVHSPFNFASKHMLIRYLYSMVKSGTPGIGSKDGASLPAFITQQIEPKRDSLDSFSDRFSTPININEYELKVQPYSPTEQPTSSSSNLSVIAPVDEVPRVPEFVLNSASVRRPSVPDAPKSVHPDSVLDQV